MQLPDHAAAFDVVVTDHHMPDVSGLDVCAAARAARSDLPLIVSSGFLSEALVAETTRLGLSALLKKENTFEELPLMLRRVLDARAH